MMQQTAPLSTENTRRPVAGYLLASIVVGVIGLVTAILLTVSGIMNTFSDVSESYEDVVETGIEVGSGPIELELQDARYTVLTFSTDPEQPSVAEQVQQCSITNAFGDSVATNTATQPVSEAEAAATGYPLSGIQHVIFTHFEARDATYTIDCQQPGLLSDGTGYQMGSTAKHGVFIGLGSVLIAGGLFVMGVVNSSRNKKAQAQALAAYQNASGIGH